jgi:putative PIN family toxin of toxin-antitoxin system
MLNRFVFDTNVLVSAVLMPDSSAAFALFMAIDNGILVASPSLMKEYHSVFLRPKFDRYVSQKNRRAFLQQLQDSVEWIEPQSDITDCRDPKDNMILEIAIESRARAIVTGDRDLLVLNPYHGIPILTPVDFRTLILES